MRSGSSSGSTSAPDSEDGANRQQQLESDAARSNNNSFPSRPILAESSSKSRLVSSWLQSEPLSTSLTQQARGATSGRSGTGGPSTNTGTSPLQSGANVNLKNSRLGLPSSQSTHSTPLLPSVDHTPADPIHQPAKAAPTPRRIASPRHAAAHRADAGALLGSSSFSTAPTLLDMDVSLDVMSDEALRSRRSLLIDELERVEGVLVARMHRRRHDAGDLGLHDAYYDHDNNSNNMLRSGTPSSSVHIPDELQRTIDDRYRGRAGQSFPEQPHVHYEDRQEESYRHGVTPSSAVAARLGSAMARSASGGSLEADRGNMTPSRAGFHKSPGGGRRALDEGKGERGSSIPPPETRLMVEELRSKALELLRQTSSSSTTAAAAHGRRPQPAGWLMTYGTPSQLINVAKPDGWQSFFNSNEQQQTPSSAKSGGGIVGGRSGLDKITEPPRFVGAAHVQQGAGGGGGSSLLTELYSLRRYREGDL